MFLTEPVPVQVLDVLVLGVIPPAVLETAGNQDLLDPDPPDLSPRPRGADEVTTGTRGLEGLV